MIQDPFSLLIVFLGIISLTLTLTSGFAMLRKISPILLILFFSAALANIGVIPTEHDFYRQLTRYAVPFAVCQILLHVHLSDIRKTGVPMLKAFAVACLGAVAGCLLAGMVLSGLLDAILAGEGWKLAGPYIGTYTGGSLNFVSMWSGLEIEHPDLFAAANAVDNLTLLPIFMFWVLAPFVLKKWYPDVALDTAELSEVADKAPTLLRLNDLVKLAFIGLAIIAISDLTRTYIVAPLAPQIPTILIVTTFALLAAQSGRVQALQGAKELGNVSFYLFFAVIGAMMDIAKAIRLAPVLFLYVALVVVTQIAFVLVVGRLLKMDLKMLAVVSIAAKAGPTSAAAFTNAKNWNALALPGVTAALLGYAVGNYFALAGAYLLKLLLNGS